ncbi:MAG: formate dehydrogenase accessory sulfurtransferase FdhD [Armatimonadota bacterium]
MDSEGALQPVQSCQAVRITATGAVHEECLVVVEQPLTITIDGVGAYTLMCTPTHLPALAIGFAFSEGIITSARDIDLLYHCEDDPTAVRMRLGRVPEVLPERNLIVSSSCGMCGNVAVDALIAALPAVEHTLAVPASCVHQVQAEMRTRQQLFAQTGGTHAAAIFTPWGQIIAFAEDIGRHNALDKCLGQCLLTGQPTAGCGALLSGRASLEMVVKAARAGIEIVAAVSAPSSLAVDAAAHCGITLCGFVRENRLTAFTHPARITQTPTR